jgi:hypothetical protein
MYPVEKLERLSGGSRLPPLQAQVEKGMAQERPKRTVFPIGQPHHVRPMTHRLDAENPNRSSMEPIRVRLK